ncbi:unnamed protein product, partial [Mesorhabditis spiculigera]
MSRLSFILENLLRLDELVTHFRTTGKSLPNGSNELFTLRKAKLRQPELLEHGRVEQHEAVGDLDLYTVYRGTFRMGNDAVAVAVKKLKADFVGDPKKKAKFLTEAYSLLKIRDVWAFGVLCWEVYADGGADPYPGMTNQEVRLMLLEGTGRRMVIPDEFPNFIRKVLEKCWEEIWCERPSFKRLVRYLEKVQNTMAAELEQVAAEEGAPDGDGVPADHDGDDGVDDQGSGYNDGQQVDENHLAESDC